MHEEDDIKQLLNAGQIKDLKIISTICNCLLRELFKHWKQSQSRPSNVTFSVSGIIDHLELIDYN